MPVRCAYIGQGNEGPGVRMTRLRALAMLCLTACGASSQAAQETDAAGSTDGGPQDATAPPDHAGGPTGEGGAATDGAGAEGGNGGVRGDAGAGEGAGAAGDGSAGGNGAAGDGGWPTPTAICGTSMLDGPSSAPAGAITLSPGPSTIQDAIAAHPAGGTTY